MGAMNNNLKALREKNGLSIIELSKISGIGRDIIYKMEKGTIGISKKNIPLLEKALGVSASSLFGGCDSMIPIKYYSSVFDFSDKKCEFINIDKTQLAEMGIEKDYNDIVIIKINDDSMYPTIVKGDLLFINTKQKQIYNDKIYIIQENNNLKVKRVLRKSPFDTTITIKSDNQISGEFPPYEIDLNDKEKADCIKGQVLSFCRGTSNINY